jgi:hypothetical protein
MPRSSTGTGEPRNTLDLCAEAGALLRSIGFELVQTSMKSEATYWRFPSRHGVLRVGAHAYKGGTIGLSIVVATITFRGGRRARHMLTCSPKQIETMLWLAIGQYMVRSATPQPSNYDGPGVRANGRGIEIN